METNVNYRGIPLIVDYKYEGQYFAATRDTPEEFPDLHITSIKVEDSDIDVQKLMDWRDIEEIKNLIDE